MKAEPQVQHRFSLLTHFLATSVMALVLLAHHSFMALPDREALGPPEVVVKLSPVELDQAAFQPLRLVGAWTLESDDPRFGGISALALDGRDFVAITDFGIVIRLPIPGRHQVIARIIELPDGPSSAGFKKNRDSEALARDPFGRGCWVAFENANQLWLYDWQFRRALGKVRIPKAEARLNWGAEGLAAEREGLLILPEGGGLLLRFRRSGWSEVRFDNPARRSSDLAALPSGSLLVVEREPRPFGFANALVRLDRCATGYCLAWRKPLPLGFRDNVEAVSIEQRPSGAPRLWLMTDNDGRRRIRTLLIALDLPPQF